MEKDKEKNVPNVPSLFGGPIQVQSRPLQITDPAAIAAAEAAKARLQSMYIMAYNNPRNPDMARDSILHACKRTGFAEKVEFSKPVGGKQIKGPSVRFAELAFDAWGNTYKKAEVIYEDDTVRRMEVFCIDLERNVTHSKEIVVQKTVERKKPTEDREIISERINTKGEKVYIVRATEDEMQNKESALISKTFRNESLRLIPADIIDESIDIARKTLLERDKQDPDAAKKQVLDAFSSLGVRPKDIEFYLGHSMEQLVPAELQNLRAMYRAIKDGEATWKEYMEKEEGIIEVEVDEGLIVKFDKESTDRKVDQALMVAFLTEIGKSMGLSVEQVKVEALKEMPRFWKQYESWASKKIKEGKKDESKREKGNGADI